MRQPRLMLAVLSLATTAPAAAHDLTMGGSRWCIRNSGIVATIDLDSSLLLRIPGVGRDDEDLESRSEAHWKQVAADVIQPYVDRKLAIAINGAGRRAKVNRVAKAGGLWQIWLSVDRTRLDRPRNTVKIDYRLLFEETGGTHVNMAYLYLVRDETESVQRIFDFSQPTWQMAFESGATTWEQTVRGPARPAVPVAVAPHARREAPNPLPGPARETTGAAASSAGGDAGGADAGDAPKQPERIPWWKDVGRFVLLGIEHILSGYDHIAFLLALIVIAPSFRAVLPIVTAFTAAHSITLLVAALGLVRIDSRVVESAIALSICYVAVENLFRRKVPHRWHLTFAFGLVHGFGFASVLENLIVGKTNLVVSVVSFNVGVEIGQLMIFAVTLPVLRLVGKMVDPRKVAVAASSAIGALGCAWLIERGFDLRLLPS